MTPENENANPAIPPARSSLRIGLLVTVLVSVLALAGLGWLTATRSGFSLLWQGLGRVSGQALVVDKVEGTLWQGFTLAGLHYRDRANRIDIEHLTLDWQPAALWHRQLSIRRLDLGLVQLRTPPGAPPPVWPRLPPHLRLPLDVNIQQLSIAGVSLEPEHLAVYAVEARYQYAGGHHHFILQHMRVPAAELAGQFSVAAQAPFAVEGRVQLQADAGLAELHAGGDLMKLRLQGTARANPVSIDLDGVFAPFDPQPFQRIRQLNLKTSRLDPQQLVHHWPHAALDIAVHITPDARLGSRGSLTLLNHQPGAWSMQRLPLVDLQAQLLTDGVRLEIPSLAARLTRGTIALHGSVSPRQLSLDASLSDIALQALHASAPVDALSGHLTLRGTVDAPRFEARLHGHQLQADLDLGLESRPGGRVLLLHRALLAAGSGQLGLSGTMDMQRQFRLKGVLQHADPSRLHSSWPKGDINAVFNSHGQLGTIAQGGLQLAFTPSRFSGAPLHGGLAVEWRGDRLLQATADLTLAGNHMTAHGAYGKAGDQVRISLLAPELSALGFGFAGTLNGQATLSGTPDAPKYSVRLDAHGLRVPGLVSMKSLNLSSDLQGGASTPFHLQIKGEQLSGAGLHLDTLDVLASGTRAFHTIQLDSRQQLASHTSRLQLQARGGWLASQSGWSGVLQQARLTGEPGGQLLAPVTLEISRQRQTLGAGRLRIAGGELRFDSLTRDAAGAIRTHGQMIHLGLAQLQPWLGLPVASNLVVDGSWNLAPDGHGQLMIKRVGGDLVLPSAHNLPFGLNQAQLVLDWGAAQTQVDLKLASQRGSLSGHGVLSAPPLRLTSTTPVSGQLRLHLPDLAPLLTASGMKGLSAGELSLDLSLSGPLASPAMHGVLRGSHLAWQDRESGVRLFGGELSARLEGRKLLLDQLRFANANSGEMMARGQIDLAGKQPSGEVQVEIRRFRVFEQPDKRLVVSGKGTLLVSDRQMKLTGQLKADQGRFSLLREAAPSLSADVFVRGRAAPAGTSLGQLPLSVDLALDLGEHFTFSGQGLKVDLAGKVDLRSRPGTTTSAHGQVRVIKGSYQAYGQELDIESGSITFVGPLMNPNLDVRARRHLSTVGAGVEVLGSVAEPKLQLIANQTLSDRDKLSWLVLGHAASDSPQDSNFLALAAGSMAAGRLNRQVGLFDDLGLVERESRTALNGTVSPAEQVLTVGKQLSRTFYLGYEYGLTSSQQAVKLIYQLSRKWSVVLRVGADASAESRYTLRFD